MTGVQTCALPIFTLEAFAAKCHDFVKAEPGPAGRQKICTLLSQVLKDEQFVAKYVDSNSKERNVLYEDPEFGFCIIAHNYEGPKTSDPHDHGPSWAIYGQARGETAMNDWALLESASEQKPGKVKHVRTFANLIFRYFNTSFPIFCNQCIAKCF